MTSCVVPADFRFVEADAQPEGNAVDEVEVGDGAAHRRSAGSSGATWTRATVGAGWRRRTVMRGPGETDANLRNALLGNADDGVNLKQHAIERQTRHWDQRAGGLRIGAIGKCKFVAEDVQMRFSVVNDQDSLLNYMA